MVLAGWNCMMVELRELMSHIFDAERGRASNGYRWTATKIISNFNSPEYGIKNSDVERSGCTWELRAKGGMYIVEVGLLTEEEEIAAAQHPEEILPRETRLKGIRGVDNCNGVSISSQIWEWRHRWHVHYEKAGIYITHLLLAL